MYRAREGASDSLPKGPIPVSEVLKEHGWEAVPLQSSNAISFFRNR
jgi:hypothetical protein